MQPHSVALINLGENLSVDLPTLADRLNSIQSSFEFIAGGTITLETVGDPDVEEVWYSVNALYQVMRLRIATSEFDFIVGVTHLPLAYRDNEGGTVDKNYFALSDLHQCSIVTTHQNVMTFKSPWKTEYQYLAYLIIAELLINMTGQNLIHLMANNCLFDDCVDRTRLAECISRSHICKRCMPVLKAHNVGDGMITDVEEILNWCRKDTLGMTLLFTIKHPLTGFCAGIGLGWLASALVPAQHYSIMLLLTLAPPLLLFIYRRFSE